MSAKLFLHQDSVLTRTEDGTAKMRARTTDLSPKLRAVLFLVDGQRTYGELLDRAGALRDLLDSQLRDLIAMGLLIAGIPVRGGGIADATDATAPVSRGHGPKAADLPPVVAAKMQLLLRLESIRSEDIDILGAELLEARTLRDLAVTAKSVAGRLRASAGPEESDRFWRQAKEILTAWRDISAKAPHET
jgi:hypothetical protein